jgi:hypothetical protein
MKLQWAAKRQMHIEPHRQQCLEAALQAHRARDMVQVPGSRRSAGPPTAQVMENRRGEW